MWNLYLSLPTQTSRDLGERKKTQAEFLRVRKELNATSSQDQFAKWAKLRRQHDKLLEQLEKSSTWLSPRPFRSVPFDLFATIYLSYIGKRRRDHKKQLGKQLSNIQLCVCACLQNPPATRSSPGSTAR